MNKDKRRQICQRFQQDNPNPTTELEFASLFELLIAVMLSAQATDISVNKATAKLFAVANTPEAILAMGEDQLKAYIQHIGLFNSKASNVIKTCQILLDKYKGKVPGDMDALVALPGVGRKTANVVLNTAFNLPVIPVDTHVFRVANRTGLGKGKTPNEVEKRLSRLVHVEYLPNLHHWLVLHGRYVCLARKPKCDHCIIKDLCEYKDKTKS